jgi:hypothetical protein
VIGAMLKRMRSETLARKSQAFYRITAIFALVALIAGVTTGCATHREEQRTMEAPAPDIWEMTIMAGRYGVMLSQARAILGLAQPALAGENPLASERQGERQERHALARYQVAVASEFFADTALACAKSDAPRDIRVLACSHQNGVPAHLRKPVRPHLGALSARNDALGEIIMPWWDAVCALAPKPGAGEDPACVME